MAHAFITVVIPFAQQRLDDVDAVIRSLSNEKEGNRPIGGIVSALDTIAIVHYMSIVAVSAVCPARKSEDPRDRDPEESYTAHLLIEASADGGVGEVLAVLGRTLGAEFEAIFAAAQVNRKSESIEKFLGKHARKIGAGWFSRALGQIHTGSPGMTVRRICQERDLALWIGDRIDEYRRHPPWRNLAPRQRLDWIRRDVWGWDGPSGDGEKKNDSKWAFVEEPAPVLPGDPANPWNDSGYTLKNPQAVKALGWILHTLLWPLYVPLFLAWWYLSSLAWQDGLSFHAVIWPIFVFLFLVGLLAASGATLFLLLRRRELADAVDDRVPPSEQVASLMKVENFAPGAQNHMATVSRLKPGWLRRLTLRIAFIVVGSGRFVGAPGFLGKNGVIHFARWIRLPRTSQLVFFSNFDNTWESYVADFIADAPSGVTAIWSNCRGFPRSKLLFGGGAEDHDRLVQWARRQQQPTLFWYSAYPALTTERIRKNAAIRQGLASAASDADARDWLALFGSAARPANALDIEEIPTMVFGGLSNRSFAACLAVRWNDDAGAARAWLSSVAAVTTYGDAPSGLRSAVVLALSASGLRKLELPEEALATFPTAFQQGMWREWRARELGDIDGNAPDKWAWGGNDADQRVDALVLVYAKKEVDLDDTVAEFRKSATEQGHEVHIIPLKPTELAKRPDGSLILPNERFGFADGVSQPVIRGAPRKNMRALENDLVAPGEIVLGYPDNIGTLPPSPSLADKHDPQHYLPDRGPDPFRRRPEFSRYEPKTGERDLGANGTFLVVRQLEQLHHVFEQWIDDEFHRLQHDPSVQMSSDGETSIDIKIQSVARPSADGYAPSAAGDTPSAAGDAALAAGTPGRAKGAPITMHRLLAKGDYVPISDAEKPLFKQLIAAKMVGRWQDGSSLVRNPEAPASSGGVQPVARPDNAFMLGAEDPRGLSCPFGAHIRRANPRDTRFHDTAQESRTEIAGVNRHRILRVGRGYDYPEGTPPKQRTGLLFMCVNADIERQFEFIQKTWLLNRNLHGLENETDPLLGCGKRNFTIPTPNGPVRLTIDKDFVQMKGGGYFFMPSRAALRYLTRGTLAKSSGPFAGIA